MSKAATPASPTVETPESEGTETPSAENAPAGGDATAAAIAEAVEKALAARDEAATKKASEDAVKTQEEEAFLTQAQFNDRLSQRLAKRDADHAEEIEKLKESLTSPDVKALQDEVAKAKKELAETRLSSAVEKAAKDAKVTEENRDLVVMGVLTLGLEGLSDENGELDEAKVTASVAEFVKKYPTLTRETRKPAGAGAGATVSPGVKTAEIDPNASLENSIYSFYSNGGPS